MLLGFFSLPACLQRLFRESFCVFSLSLDPRSDLHQNNQAEAASISNKLWSGSFLCWESDPNKRTNHPTISKWHIRALLRSRWTESMSSRWNLDSWSEIHNKLTDLLKIWIMDEQNSRKLTLTSKRTFYWHVTWNVSVLCFRIKKKKISRSENTLRDHKLGMETRLVFSSRPRLRFGVRSISNPNKR